MHMKTQIRRIACCLFVLLFILIKPSFSQFAVTDFCSGSTRDLLAGLSVVTTGKTFTWTTSGATNVSSATPGVAQPTITQKLLSTNGTGNGTINYSVTASDGTKFTIAVTVLPIPTISNTATWNSISIGCGTNINFTAAASVTVPTSGWTWSRPAVLGASALTGTSNLINDNLINTTASTVNIAYTVIMTTALGCTNSQTLTYTISPTPVITNAIQYDTICSGTPITFIPTTSLTPSPNGPFFAWANPATTGITGASAATAANKFSNFNQTLNNTTANSINTTYNLIPSYNYTGFSCTGSTFQIFITVNPKPNIANAAINACSGSAFSFDPTSIAGNIIPKGTQYTWTAPQYSDPSLLSGGSGLPQTPVPVYNDPPISQTLTSKSNGTLKATYNVFAMAGTCAANAAFDLIVTLSPLQDIVIKDTLFTCSGTPPTFPASANIQPGLNFTWAAPQISPANSVTGTGISAQITSTTLFAPTLNNQTTTTSYANFLITPNNGGTCIGKPFPVVVSISPTANVGTQTSIICSEASFKSSPINVPQNTLYTWNSPSLSTGVSVIGSGQNLSINGDSSITGSLSYNGIDSGGTATYTVVPKNGNCIGKPFNVIVTVRPLPSVSTASQVACSGVLFSSTPTSNLTNIATSYTWDLPVITPANAILGASANTSPVQSIIQALVDTTTSIAQATYTVTPVALGCTGKKFSFIATVNPTPNFSNKDTIICSGLPLSINPSALPYITSYTWESPTLNIPNALIGMSAQTGSPLPNFSQVLTNVTNSIDILATYKVTPRYGDCIGKPFSLVITVKAAPYLTDTLYSTVCSGSAFTVKMPKNIPSSTQYIWDEPVYTNGITGGGVQTVLQNTISQTLRNTNSDTTSGAAYYSVTPSANSCSGIPFVVKVTVKANSATLKSTLTPPAICSGSTFNYTPLSTLPNTAFTWVRDSVPGIQNKTGTGYSDVTEILIDTLGDPVTVNYRFSLTFNGCVNLKTQIVTVTINPKPELTSSVSPTPICSGNTFNYISNSNTRDVTFNWTRSYVVGISESISQGTNGISEILTNSTYNTVSVPYVFNLASKGCTNQQTVYEIVNPVLTLNDMTNPICSGTNFKITPSNTVNAVFLWSTPQQANGIIGGQENSLLPASSINGLLTNLSDTPNTALYTVLPIIPGASSGGCLGNPFKVKVVVNPIPVLSSATLLPAICSGTQFKYTPTSKTPGTIFSWTRDSIPGISNKPTKGTFLIDETLIDSTIEAVNVTYKYRTTFNGCTDSTQTVSFTMNPSPVISDQKKIICSGNVFSLPTTLEPLRTTYTWSDPVIVPSGSLKGFTARSNPQTSVYDTLNNLTTTNAVAIYTIQPNNPTCKLQPFNVTVTVNPISLVGDQLINTCNNGKAVFKAIGVPDSTRYKWVFNDPNPPFALSGYTNNDTAFQSSVTQKLNNTSNNIVNANYLVSTSTNGCTGKPFNLKMIVNPTPKIKITAATGLCGNAIDSLQLSFTGTAPWSFSYIDNKDSLLTQMNGYGNQNSFFIQSSLPKTAFYKFSILHINDAFCNNDTSNAQPVLAEIIQTIYQLPKDTIIAPGGNLICVGNYQPMYITPLAKTYQWYFNDSIIPGATSVNYNAYLQGVYSAKITDSLNCANKTVNSIKMVDLSNFRIVFNTDSINCINVTKPFLNKSDTSSIRNITWAWKFNGEDSSSGYNAFIKFLKPGLKKISLSATVPSCIYSINKDTLISIAQPLPGINLQTQSTSANRPIQLQARTLEGAQYKYSWQPVWGLDFLNIKDPVFTYYKSQKYFISMTSPDGCITVDTVKVNVFDSAIVDIFVPKSFTPNGDGVNDMLYVYLAGVKSLNIFKIINKWGKTVFESRNSAEGWNGMSGGTPQPMDAYSWMAEGLDYNGNPVRRTGNVLLIR